MQKYSKLIIVLLSTILVVAYNNCSNGFELNSFDEFASNEGTSLDDAKENIETVGNIDPVNSVDPIVIVDPIPPKPISPSYKDVFITNPDWSFKDDFESSKKPSFWIHEESASRATNCRHSPSWKSKVVQLNFIPGAEPSEPHDSFSELKFKLPVKAVEIEVRYKQFVPPNFVHANSNQKNIVFWSGKYGVVNTNITVASELWPTSGGATPAITTGGNGRNNGHHMLTTKDKIFHDKQGSWQDMAFYVKLADRPGDYGVFRIYRNGNYITGTDHPDIRRPGSYSPESSKSIIYSPIGNYIDQGYVMGWVNNGFKEDTYFCIDDFEIKVKTK